MKILIDMNLSPDWVALLQNEGWDTVHWSSIGEGNTPDFQIMQWAKTNGYMVFTHDLDFGALLAASKDDSPSVFQVRMQEVRPAFIGKIVVQSLRRFEPELTEGAIVTVNEASGKARILPL
jgi:predicted nuclease of predicted toxin-antitoxin system